MRPLFFKIVDTGLSVLQVGLDIVNGFVLAQRGLPTSPGRLEPSAALYDQDDEGLIMVDTTEAMRAALFFYADFDNWQGRPVPLSQLSVEDQTRFRQSIEGFPGCDDENCDVCGGDGFVAWRRGPAIDGGEHARFALNIADMRD